MGYMVARATGTLVLPECEVQKRERTEEASVQGRTSPIGPCLPGWGVCI